MRVPSGIYLGMPTHPHDFGKDSFRLFPVHVLTIITFKRGIVLNCVLLAFLLIHMGLPHSLLTACTVFHSMEQP